MKISAKSYLVIIALLSSFMLQGCIMAGRQVADWANGDDDHSQQSQNQSQ